MTSEAENKLTNLIVINPISGNGRAAGLLRELREGTPAIQVLAGKYFTGSPATWPIVETTADHSWKTAAEAHLRTGRVHSVIVIGGDGSLMAVAAFLYEYARSTKKEAPWLIPVPGGRGNDFVRGLCGYTADDGDFWKWAAKQSRWTESPLDLASGNGRLFVNMASVGYGGRVVEKAQSRKAFWSKTPMVYQVEGAIAMLETGGGRCEMKADGKTVYSGEFFGAFVGNGKANGSGLYWTRDAEVNDGKIDAIVFPRPGLYEMTKSLGAVKQKKAPTFRHTAVQANEIIFHFERDTPLELDGDYVGAFLTQEFRCLGGVLRVISVNG